MDKSNANSNFYFVTGLDPKFVERSKRRWSYNEPLWNQDGDIVGDTIVTMNENQILKEYFPHWSAEMIKVGKQDMISEERCLDEWTVVNWAWLEDAK